MDQSKNCWWGWSIRRSWITNNSRTFRTKSRTQKRGGSDALIPFGVRCEEPGLGIVIWIALKLFRIRTPQNRSLAWITVLLAALTMPRMQVMKTVMASTPRAAVSWILTAPPSLLLPPLSTISSADSSSLIDWVTLASTIYLLVAVPLFIRLLEASARSAALQRGRTAQTGSGPSDVMFE